MPARLRWLLLLVAASAPASAAEPVPDRPFLTPSGALVAGRSFEVEAGGAWLGDRFGAPLRAKVGLGSFEPRLGVDLAGLGSGAPGLNGGLKIGLVQQQGVQIAGYGQSVVPLGVADVWSGELGGALTAGLDSGAQVRLNAGWALVGSGGRPVSAGAPLRGMVSTPLGRRLHPFGEVEAIVGQGVPDWTVQGGVGLQPTESLIFDAGIGWDLGQRTPLVQVGLTANAGGLK